MIETAALITLLLGFWGLLIFLYFHIKKDEAQELARLNYIKELQQIITNLPLELQKFYGKLLSEIDSKSQKMVETSFKDYLKHIQSLEQLALDPPSQRRVADLFPPPIENEIEKKDFEGLDISGGNLSGIPFGAENLNIVNEEDLPTVIE